ncbi:hypothetical protein [Prevotella sp. oral taxon 376]|uniref:hypothetical protein n=1 Tax=Prevotella sp. oral taxon 376 TaxID=712466 RepID=UPI001304B746|nr:hypothetical protein [Prevotella sp. oral taxon 376]
MPVLQKVYFVAATIGLALGRLYDFGEGFLSPMGFGGSISVSMSMFFSVEGMKIA